MRYRIIKLLKRNKPKKFTSDKIADTLEIRRRRISTLLRRMRGFYNIKHKWSDKERKYFYWYAK